MIDEIVGQAKQNQSEYHGNRFKKVDSASAEAESKKGKRIPHMDYEAVRLLTMKKVIGRNKKTMEKLEFESIKSASEALKIDRTSISKALHKTIKSAGNYYWELAVKAA